MRRKKCERQENKDDERCYSEQSALKNAHKTFVGRCLKVQLILVSARFMDDDEKWALSVFENSASTLTGKSSGDNFAFSFSFSVLH